MADHNETLRFPTNLDQAAIVRRLARIRDAAQANGHAELAARFAGVETMLPAQIGACVIGAMTWLQDKAEHRPVAIQLEMLAVNLKNLK